MAGELEPALGNELDRVNLAGRVSGFPFFVSSMRTRAKPPAAPDGPRLPQAGNG